MTLVVFSFLAIGKVMIKQIKHAISMIFKNLAKFKYIQVENFSLKATTDCRLDEFLTAFPNYSRNFSKLVAEILDEDKTSLIVDIGANIGDTAALLRSKGVSNPILCIEGNPIYINLLKLNATLFNDVEIVQSFLGDKVDKIIGTVITKEGTAKIIQEGLKESIKTTTLDQLFSENNYKNLKILKVDTDGFDILILQGANKTIQEFKPIIFFEYDNSLNIATESCLEYLLSLSRIGYKKVLFYDNFGNLLVSLNLTDQESLQLLDKYINNSFKPFPYYDVAVFHENDLVKLSSIFPKILN